MEILIGKLAQHLMEKQLTLTLAESCTGGMLAQQCTSVSGSSKWFECGFVTYSNASKIRLLGVQAEVLDEYGAVSSQVAEQMARGALQKSDANLSIAITGIAGPDGGSEDKPLGTVFIATSLKDGVNNPSACAVKYLFKGDREPIRQQASSAAIEQILAEILNAE